MAVAPAAVAAHSNTARQTGHVSRAAKAHVHWSFQKPQIEAGRQPAIRYRFRHVPKHAQRAVEVQVGTAHVWQVVKRLHHDHGSARLPAAKQGKYLYRLAVAAPSHRLLAEQTNPLLVFGPVGLDVLMRHNSTRFDIHHGSTQIGTTLYNFVYESPFSSGGTALKIHHSSCRSLQLTAANKHQAFKLAVLQSLAAAQETKVQRETIGELSAVIPLGGAVQVHLSVHYSVFHGGNVFGNGVGDCYTDTGHQ